MMKFKVLIIAGEDVFIELAQALVLSLKELGHEASISENETDYGEDATIVIKANRQFNHYLIPGIKILFQTEQLWDIEIRGEYYLSKGWDRVLEIFQSNMLPINSMDNVRLCPIGWSPMFESGFNHYIEDIDVYFYGAQTPHRKEIMENLITNMPGLSIRSSGQDFGESRDRYISRSKIILYLKAYERWNYAPLHCLLAQCNKKLVICENIDEHGSNSSRVHPYIPGKHFIEYRTDGLCKQIMKWKEPSRKRNDFIDSMYKDLRENHDFTKYLKEGLKGII